MKIRLAVLLLTHRVVVPFLIVVFLALTPVKAETVNFSHLELSNDARNALAAYNIDLPSRPITRRNQLLGGNALELRETQCDNLDIVFQRSAEISSVTLSVTNRHLRTYFVRAYTALDSEDLIDENRFTPTSTNNAITHTVAHTLTSDDLDRPIVKVSLSAAGVSGLGCFDQAAITGLKYETLSDPIPSDPIPIEAEFSRSYPSRLRTVALHQWYNRATNDNYITTDTLWRGREGLRRQGYGWVGVIGYALSPRAGQPPGTQPLHTWYSESKNDYRTTTSRWWIPANSFDTRRDDYVHVRHEGYVFKTDHALAGTWPLQMHYSSSRQEYDTTTRIPMLSRPGSRSDEYVNRGTQGYVIAARPGDAQPGRDWGGGIGKSRRDDGTVGTLTGTRHVLFIGQNYSNARLQNNPNYYAGLLSSNANWNVRDYFEEISGGRYSIVNRGWAGTTQILDDNSTLYDERNINCMAWVPSEGARMANGRTYTRAQYRASVCPGFRHQSERLGRGTDSWGRRKIRWMIQSALREIDAVYNFSQHDGNNGGSRDNRIEAKELIIVLVMAMPPEPFNRSTYPAVNQEYGGINRNAACFAADGVRLCNDLIIVNDGVNLATLAHEIMHSIDNGSPDQDLYGGGQSTGLSLKSATVGSSFNERKSYTLDPWHRLRLGWVQPNIQPIHEQVPPGSAILPNDGRVPVMFMSRERRGLEYFIAEHRIRSRYHTADLLNSQGIHVWYVNTPNGRGATLQPAEYPTETNWACDARNRRWAAPTSNPGQPVGGPTGASLWSIGFEDRRLSSPQCFKNRRGGWWTPLTKSRGERELLWYPPNPQFGGLIPASTPSGLKLKAGELRDDGMDLEWNSGDLPFRPLITRWTTVGDNWQLEGNFGLPENRSVWLISPTGERQALEIVREAWTAERIEVRSTRLLQAGTYEIQIENDLNGTLGNVLTRRAF